MATSNILHLSPAFPCRFRHFPLLGIYAKHFATLTKKQKELLADGPDLADFIEDPDLGKTPEKIVKKKGER